MKWMDGGIEAQGCSAGQSHVRLRGPLHLEFFLWLLRGDKYGFITYRYSEHAALSLKNGTSLRKRNEPSFQLSSGGLGHFFWTRYADLGKKAGAAFFPKHPAYQHRAVTACCSAEPSSRKDLNFFKAYRESPPALLWLTVAALSSVGWLGKLGGEKKSS